MCIRKLISTFKSRDLSVLMEKSNVIQNENKSTFDSCKYRCLSLIQKEEITGFDLSKIYENVKDLEFEGNYNIFREKLHQHLVKLKYYK